MPIDPAKMAAALGAAAKRSEDTAYKRTGKVTNAFFDRVIREDADTVAEVIEVLLGIRAGGAEKVIELLGVTTEPETPELPAATSRPLPVFKADGTHEGVALREDQAIAAGYGYKLGDDGTTVIGWQKPPDVDDTATAPATPAAGDREVPVKDKKGRITRNIKVKDGIADPNLEAILDDDGTTVDHFQVKVRLLRR